MPAVEWGAWWQAALVTCALAALGPVWGEGTLAGGRAHHAEAPAAVARPGAPRGPHQGIVEPKAVLAVGLQGLAQADFVRPRAHPPPDATCVVVFLRGYEGSVRYAHTSYYDSRPTLRFMAGDADADGNNDGISLFAYDSWGRMVEMARDDDWDGGYDDGWRYKYDEAGRLVEEAHDDEWDGVADRTKTYAYNERGWMVSAFIDDDGDGVIDDATYIYYDSQGNPTLMEGDGNGDGVIDVVVKLEYVDRLAVRREVDWGPDGVVDDITVWTYDSGGRVVLIEYDVDADGVINESYRHSYNERGWLVRVELYYGNGTDPHVTDLYTRDELDRITEYRVVHGGLRTSLRRYSYSDECVPTLGTDLPVAVPAPQYATPDP